VTSALEERPQFERRAEQESTPIGQNLDVCAVAAPDLGMDIVYHEWDKPPKPRCGGIDREGDALFSQIDPDLDRSRSIKRRSIHEMSSALVAGTSCALLEKRT
jgi:hypothetical protein